MCLNSDQKNCELFDPYMERLGKAVPLSVQSEKQTAFHGEVFYILYFFTVKYFICLRSRQNINFDLS